MSLAAAVVAPVKKLPKIIIKGSTITFPYGWLTTRRVKCATMNQLITPEMMLTFKKHIEREWANRSTIWHKLAQQGERGVKLKVETMRFPVDESKSPQLSSVEALVVRREDSDSLPYVISRRQFYRGREERNSTDLRS